jgi:hypothetical protein
MQDEPLIPQQAPTESFPTYDSPFESYPLLRSRLRRMLADDPATTTAPILQEQQEAGLRQPTTLRASSSSLPSFISSSSLSPIVSAPFIPDLKPLKKAASFNALDPSKQICQYELPGGGVCRDEGCQDIHLSRAAAVVDGVEPTGTCVSVRL